MCLRSNLSRQCDYVSMGERVGLYISTSKTKELRLQGVRNPLFIFLQGYIPSYLNFWLNWSRLPLFLLKSCLPYWTWYSNCLVRKKCVSWLGDSGSGGFWVSLGKNCCKKGAEPKTSQRLLCSFFCVCLQWLADYWHKNGEGSLSKWKICLSAVRKRVTQTNSGLCHTFRTFTTAQRAAGQCL